MKSLIRRRLRLWALNVSSGLLCNFVEVCLTFVQFILQLKLCLYTIVHLLLEEFKSLILGPESESESGVWSPKFSNPGVGVRVPHKTRTPHPCLSSLITTYRIGITASSSGHFPLTCFLLVTTTYM